MTLRGTFVTLAPSLILLAGIPMQPARSADKAPSLQEQVVGTWTLGDLHADTWDGDDRNPFGSDPKGQMILDRAGRVTLVIIGADRPKFVLADRLTGSAEENKAAVQSTQAFYGTYSVNETEHTMAFHVERSSFPNWDGTVQITKVSVDGDEMRQSTLGPHESHGWSDWTRVREIRIAEHR